MAEQATQQTSAQQTKAATQSTHIVVNDSDRIKGFAFAVKADSGAIEHVTTRLRPGANRVGSVAFERHEKDFRADDQVWMLEKSFAALSVRDARDLAKRTIDTDLLRAFASVEKRDEIKKILAEQIAACSERATKPASTDDEDEDA